jgi:DedD protein
LNEHVKQRLVGAVVLVSLAVIFIPMLLDSGEQGGMPLFGSNIPKKPDYQFQPLDIPLDPVKPIEGDKPLLVEKAEPAPPKVKPVVPKVKPAPEKAQQPAAAKPAKKPLVVKAEPVPENKPTQDSIAWVVQVGSFSNSANAIKLRNKLRAKGFTAFVEKLEGGEGDVYRVRVGPELKREIADTLRDKLQQQMKLKGIVMGYSS